MKVFAVFVLIFALEVNLKPVFDDDSIIFPDDCDFTSEGLCDSSEIEGRMNSEIVDLDLESGPNYQGDIILLTDQKELFFANDTEDGEFETRTGLLLLNQRWPKNRHGFVTVPFTIEKNVYTLNQLRLIQNAMIGIQKRTCIRFVKRKDQEDYVNIYSGGGCSSYLGKVGQKQDVSLKSDGCMVKGIIQHELIHSLGFDHMHSHIDRDKYVRIIKDNVHPSMLSNFDKVNPKIFGNFNTTYDLHSVMHYHSTAFSINGKDTIVPRNSRYKTDIGQRRGISTGDATRINNMYKCY